MTEHFCTMADRRYLARALALHGSLVRHAGDFTLWVLCLDDDTAAHVASAGLAGVRIVGIDAVERDDPEAAATRSERLLAEYYFTIGPSFIDHVLATDATIDRITYLDADLWFFSEPQPVFDEIGDAPIAIVEHRDAPALGVTERFGRFNVGWVTFTRADVAIACLRWWRDRCVEWCFDRIEPTRFADQKYLDQWPDRFDGVHVIRHLGLDVAPWNLDTVPPRVRDGAVVVGDVPLVAFHFSTLSQRGRGIFDTNLARFETRLTRTVRRHIYRPYVRELTRIAPRGFAAASTQRVDPNASTRGALGALRPFIGALRDRQLVTSW